MEEPILLEIQDQVARITLNRPTVFNSFNRAMALALQEALDQCAAEPGIRAVLLIGAGKAFCAGQDLNEVIGEGAPSFETILGEHYNPIIEKMRALEKPIVVGVNGVAAGAGANIALAGDILIASEHASFIQAFSRIGLVPDSGGTFFLPRLVGWHRATALMMLGDKIDALEAQAMGMVYRVVPAEKFADEAWALATRLAAMPTRALGLTKRALNCSMTYDLDRQLALELEFQTLAGQTADYREGVQAFLEKRTARFTGQ
ncbi:MAG: enoyl-CoA hydratase/isomerase family protein [Lewinellaceae bacterium]|nr:enoyl-CoA hydratase/isomerase family protein [Lewinellaceae bacterium]